jgi:hypothetical protein
MIRYDHLQTDWERLVAFTQVGLSVTPNHCNMEVNSTLSREQGCPAIPPKTIALQSYSISTEASHFTENLSLVYLLNHLPSLSCHDCINFNMPSFSLPSNVHVSHHPCLMAKLSQLRSKNTPAKEVKSLVHEIGLIVACEALSSVVKSTPGPQVRVSTAPEHWLPIIASPD